MHCKNCGKEVGAEKKFCSNCGTPVSKLSPMKPSTAMPLTAKKEPWTFGRGAKIAAGVLVVLVLLVIRVVSAADSPAVLSNNEALKSYDAGNNEQAVSQLQQAAQSAVTNDTKINTLKNLAYVYSAQGKTDLAIQTFQQALALTTSGSYDYYLVSGEIASLKGDPSSALLGYNQAYKINPNDFQVVNALAVFYMNMDNAANEYQDYKKAVSYGQKAVQLSDLQVAKQNLGIAYYFDEDYSQAISTLSNLTIDKNTNTAYFLGLSYAGNDDAVNAKIYLQRAIDNGVKAPQEVYDYIASH